MTPHDLGATVRQKVTPIQGTVADVQYDAAARGFKYLVQWTDADGAPSERWFTHDELEQEAQP